MKFGVPYNAFTTLKLCCHHTVLIRYDRTEEHMKVTIKDISRETGLSLATISKYLNNKKIQEKNRLRIEEAIAHLNYKPNRTAQVLRSRRTMTVAILVSDLGNYFWGTIISAVSQFFVNYNYTVITCSYSHDTQIERELLQDLIIRKIDGVIILLANLLDDRYRLLQAENIPVVALDQNPVAIGHPPVDCVVSDNYNGGALLARYLLKKGHQRVHILDPAYDSSPVAERIQGFRDVYEKAGIHSITYPVSIRFSTNQDAINEGKRHFRQLMESKESPTAIFFTNYLSALGGLMEASTSGCSIPGDVSVVTFDDDPLFRSMYPPITSLAQNLSLIGETASRILYRRMQGDYSDFPLTRCVDVCFYERQSVRDLTLDVK